MSNKILYTAIGRFLRPQQLNKNPYPTIYLGGREYYLDHQEMAVWSILAWRILKPGDLAPAYEKAMANYQIQPSRSMEACIERLITRGLVIRATGDTEYDALYELLSGMFIIPIGSYWLARILTALRLLFTSSVPLPALKKLFCKDRRSKVEKTVMALARKTQLSTAEVISCVDKKLLNIKNETAIMDCVYCDTEVTSDTLPGIVKPLPVTEPVLLAVANLYLRQQILLDRV